MLPSLDPQRDDAEFLFWFYSLASIAGTVLAGIGTAFTYYALGASGVAEILAYIAAAYLWINALALYVASLPGLVGAVRRLYKSWRQ